MFFNSVILVELYIYRGYRNWVYLGVFSMEYRLFREWYVVYM